MREKGCSSVAVEGAWPTATRLHRFVKGYTGVATIGTGGAGANLAMRRVNERLGFVVEPSGVTYINQR